MNTNHRPTISLQEAADKLGVSKSTASRLYRSGEIEGHKLTPAKNSPLRVYVDSVTAYLQRVRPHAQE